jgi:hypothetical protein
MNENFDDVCKKLATTQGGFTLWIGAGASIALTDGETPTWANLVHDLANKDKISTVGLTNLDMPEQLEILSQHMGHANFRKELKQKLYDPIQTDIINIDVYAAQTVIGLRAESIVSFNIELLSSVPFASGYPGPMQTRTFLEGNRNLVIEDRSEAGAVGKTIYFPHGQLFIGNIVMTKSEYDKHLGGFAVSTATHLAIGGNLVILGMSLSDSYLRDAIMKNRQWIHNIYWFGSDANFQEWARVSKVSIVKVPHDQLWRGMSKFFIDEDTSGKLKEAYDNAITSGKKDFQTEIEWNQKLIPYMCETRKKNLQNYVDKDLRPFVQYLIDSGEDVPDFLIKHT